MKLRPVNEFIAYTLAYFLIGLSVFWGTFLFLSATEEFFSGPRVMSDVFVLVFALLGLIAWLNAYHYLQAFKKKSPKQIFCDFLRERELPLVLAIAMTLVLVYLVSSDAGLLFLDPDALPAFALLLLPWALGENIMVFIVSGVDQYLPMAAAVNQLGILIHFFLEVGFLYYLIQFLQKTPHIPSLPVMKHAMNGFILFLAGLNVLMVATYMRDGEPVLAFSGEEVEMQEVDDMFVAEMSGDHVEEGDGFLYEGEVVIQNAQSVPVPSAVVTIQLVIGNKTAEINQFTTNEEGVAEYNFELEQGVSLWVEVLDVLAEGLVYDPQLDQVYRVVSPYVDSEL